MKIGYWKGLVVSQAIEKRCAAELEQLSAGNYKSLDLEKLDVAGEKIYSVRVNREDRLILAEHDEMLIALQYVDNHAYKKCKFLKTGVLRRYLENNGANLDEVIAAGFRRAEEEEARELTSRHRGKGLTW